MLRRGHGHLMKMRLYEKNKDNHFWHFLQFCKSIDICYEWYQHKSQFIADLAKKNFLSRISFWE